MGLGITRSAMDSPVASAASQATRSKVAMPSSMSARTVTSIGSPAAVVKTAPLTFTDEDCTRRWPDALICVSPQKITPSLRRAAQSTHFDRAGGLPNRSQGY